MLVAGVGLATAALATVLAVGDPVVAVVGLVLVGVGVANAVPLLFSAAGRIQPAGPSLAAVFSIGYLGFVAGPPTIGVLADAVTLPAALGAVCGALALVVVLGGRAVGAHPGGRPRNREPLEGIASEGSFPQ